MANPKYTNITEEDMWVDGAPSRASNTGLVLNTGSESYWFDGQSAEELFPLGNNITGKFFLLFDE